MSDPAIWRRLTDTEQQALLKLPEAIVERLHAAWMRELPPMPATLMYRLGQHVDTTVKNGLHAWLRGKDDFEGPS